MLHNTIMLLFVTSIAYDGHRYIVVIINNCWDSKLDAIWFCRVMNHKYSLRRLGVGSDLVKLNKHPVPDMSNTLDRTMYNHFPFALGVGR